MGWDKSWKIYIYICIYILMNPCVALYLYIHVFYMCLYATLCIFNNSNVALIQPLFNLTLRALKFYLWVQALIPLYWGKWGGVDEGGRKGNRGRWSLKCGGGAICNSASNWWLVHEFANFLDKFRYTDII